MTNGRGSRFPRTEWARRCGQKGARKTKNADPLHQLAAKCNDIKVFWMPQATTDYTPSWLLKIFCQNCLEKYKLLSSRWQLCLQIIMTRAIGFWSKRFPVSKLVEANSFYFTTTLNKAIREQKIAFPKKYFQCVETFFQKFLSLKRKECLQFL